jgi:hypothetical protein
MLAGKQFRLRSSSVVVKFDDARRSAVTIPAEAVVEVISGRTDDYGFVDVLWEGRTFAMLVVDLNVRGAAMTQSATA